MTSGNRKVKRLARERATKTGEAYTTARAHVLDAAREDEGADAPDPEGENPGTSSDAGSSAEPADSLRGLWPENAASREARKTRFAADFRELPSATRSLLLTFCIRDAPHPHLDLPSENELGEHAADASSSDESRLASCIEWIQGWPYAALQFFHSYVNAVFAESSPLGAAGRATDPREIIVIDLSAQHLREYGIVPSRSGDTLREIAPQLLEIAHHAPDLIRRFRLWWKESAPGSEGVPDGEEKRAADVSEASDGVTIERLAATVRQLVEAGPFVPGTQGGESGPASPPTERVLATLQQLEELARIHTSGTGMAESWAGCEAPAPTDATAPFPVEADVEIASGEIPSARPTDQAEAERPAPSEVTAPVPTAPVPIPAASGVQAHPPPLSESRGSMWWKGLHSRQTGRLEPRGFTTRANGTPLVEVLDNFAREVEDLIHAVLSSAASPGTPPETTRCLLRAAKDLEAICATNAMISGYPTALARIGQRAFILERILLREHEPPLDVVRHVSMANVEFVEREAASLRNARAAIGPLAARLNHLTTRCGQAIGDRARLLREERSTLLDIAMDLCDLHVSQEDLATADGIETIMAKLVSAQTRMDAVQDRSRDLVAQADRRAHGDFRSLPREMQCRPNPMPASPGETGLPEKLLAEAFATLSLAVVILRHREQHPEIAESVVATTRLGGCGLPVPAPKYCVPMPETTDSRDAY
jgi:hypothetical protein